MYGLVFLSNVRCGSTYLLGAMGKLPRVHADFEVKWRMPELDTLAHLHLDEAVPSFSALLGGFDTKEPWRVSKFVLHPNNPISREDIQLIRQAIVADRQNGVRFVHLTRDYFSIVLSTLLRGNWHRLAEPDKANSTPAMRAELVEAEAARGANADRDEAGQPAQPVTYARMIHTLLRLLANDLAIFDMTATNDASQPRLRLDYARIESDLEPVLARAGLPAEALAAVGSALERPMVRKMRPLDPRRLPRTAGFRAICAWCDFLLEEVVKGRMVSGQVLVAADYGPGAQAAPKPADPVLRQMLERM